MATRPLTTAREGMERIAAGDLDHRLDEAGPDEIARVARAFNGMADRISASIRTERELMAGMSHELRTPLSRLRLEVELLRDAGLPEKRLAQIEGDLTEIDGLVGQLLQLSRLQLGQRVLQTADVDWKDLVAKALSGVDVGDRTVEVRGPGGTFRGDPDLLVRVAGNLLQNCARYAPARTRITVSCQGGTLVVEDEGPGVPDDQIPFLFDPFWRADGSRARATGGLGLGLMLVRQIAVLHGGTAAAQNRIGGGLRVEIAINPPA
jgi:two-component system sensor histidine kinase RstB